MCDIIKNIEIHNPPFQYFSSVYMTLVSVFQSIAFTGILLNAVDNIEVSTAFFISLLDHFAALLVVLVIWHKYVNHHQVAGWQITITDTFMVVFFGVIEGLMIASMKHQWPGSIYPWLAALILLGAFAYHHAFRQLNANYVKEIFKKYYKQNGEHIFYSMIGLKSES